MEILRKKISDTITGAYLKCGLDIKTICGATGLHEETFRRAVSYGIIDLADLTRLCPTIGLDITEIACALVGQSQPKWQNPKRVKPAEDLYFFFRLQGDTEDQPKRIGHYDAAGYACEKDGLNHQWYHITGWREIAEHELPCLNQDAELPEQQAEVYPG